MEILAESSDVTLDLIEIFPECRTRTCSDGSVIDPLAVELLLL
jgi:hypothetical protein